jgi:hypothetical protein
MRYVHGLLLVVGGLPLVGQAWDVRAEVPFADGQSLPGTLIQGTGQLVDGQLDRGKGMILTLNHRLVRVNPILRVDWNLELAQLKTNGQFQVGSTTYGRRLQQSGFGVGVNAQFWVPFTGVAGELGLIQRLQDYRFEAAGHTQSHTLSRTWLRVGMRWRLPLPLAAPYVAASYQEPISKSRPVKLDSAQDLASYLAVQGKGQEFERLWTFGVGVQF